MIGTMTSLSSAPFSVTKTLSLEGHLLDSLTLAKVIDSVQRLGASYHLDDFKVGQTSEHLSSALLTVSCATLEDMEALLAELRPHGARLLTDTPKPYGSPLQNGKTIEKGATPFSNGNTAPESALDLQGDLLDDLVLARTLDHIQQMGGSFYLERFQPGDQKHSASHATLKISAPNADLLTIILSQVATLLPTQRVTQNANGGASVLATVAAPHPISYTQTSISQPVVGTDTPELLMCPPTHFTVSYAINPWMTEEGLPDLVLAKQQWDSLYKVLTQQVGAKVHLMEPVHGLPDLVFTANAAFISGKKAIIAHYKHPERQGEEPFAEAWFKQNGFEPVSLPRGIYFEGAGDALIWSNDGQKRVFAGYRTRTDILSHNLLTAETGLPVLSMELLDPRFYHIDVCLCPLEGGYLIYAPDAFDAYGRTVIEANVPAEKRIPITSEEAGLFAGNAVNIGDAVVMNRPAADRLSDRLKAKGFRAIGVDLSEFIKAGGSSKCLTLRLN